MILSHPKPRYPYGRPAEDSDIYWRAEVKAYSVIIDAEREEYGTKHEFELHWFKVVKHTPKGVWVTLADFGERRFVKHDARKKLAYPSIALALESFIARKTRQAGVLEARARFARHCIEWAKEYPNG